MKTPPTLGYWTRRAIIGLEHGFYRSSAHVSRALGRQRKVMTPEIYRAFSFRDKVDVKGRVLAARTLPEPTEYDSWWTNGRRMIRRWLTSEEPGARVVVSIAGTVTETVSDDEGYFELELDAPSSADTIEVWLPTSENPEIITAPILRNDYEPSVVVISDVDDTVFLSNTAKLIGMIKTALLGNALTRQIFDGVPALYQILRTGPDGNGKNPISYVTSSPWNLHSLMERIFNHRGIPAGAYFMTDWGVSHDNWLKESNPVHKRRAILKIMRWFPDAPVVLLGDSSQHDPEIYLRIAQEHPGRIAAIAIRDVAVMPSPTEPIPDSIPYLLHKDTATARSFILGKLGWERGEVKAEKLKS
ncbi:MAG: phosphatase domain-containing protein [Luteolibacter sp.]